MAQNVNSIVYSRKEGRERRPYLEHQYYCSPCADGAQLDAAQEQATKNLATRGTLGAEGEGGDPQQPEGEAREGMAMGSVSNMNVMCGCNHPYSKVRT